MKIGVQLNPRVSIDKSGAFAYANIDRAGARRRSERPGSSFINGLRSHL